MSGKEQNIFKKHLTLMGCPFGPKCRWFRKGFNGIYCNEKHIIALSSGTAAIHLGLIQLGVGPVMK